MIQDIRETPEYRAIEALHAQIRAPGSGQISDAEDVDVSPDGEWLAFTGAIFDQLEGSPSRICLTSVKSGDTRIIGDGSNADRLPKFSPDGQLIAFLSDRHEAGNFQLYLFDRISGEVRDTGIVDGFVEYLQWSADSSRILLGVAGRDADLAGGAARLTEKSVSAAPAWLPELETGGDTALWRRCWIYDLPTGSLKLVTPQNLNVWEAAWCGTDQIVAVASDAPGEGAWYTASLHIVEIESAQAREVYRPQAQLGWPSGSVLGDRVAVAEGIASDRWLVAGDLKIIDLKNGHAHTADCAGVDVSHIEWCSDDRILIAGHREFDTVVGFVDPRGGAFDEQWCSDRLTSGGNFVKVAALPNGEGFAIAAQSYLDAPQIGVVEGGKYRKLRSFDLGYGELARCIRSVDQLRWQAEDGLEIQGWLLRPTTEGPHPTIMYVHGGPVWLWRPAWLGPGRKPGLIALLQRGYALFFPNPRGSAGRGQGFARLVVGDMGGADGRDCLRGLDHLVDIGVTDPDRIGVMGGSYGGFMSAWLITQDNRFSAAVPISPATNQVSEHLVGNIPTFVRIFLDDHYTNPTGRYFERSPIMHAHKATTPTLSICGAMDKCTPPEEARQFHNALRENGVKSVLATYPTEGHGVRRLPAAIDCAARIVTWFDEHMAPRKDRPDGSPMLCAVGRS